MKDYQRKIWNLKSDDIWVTTDESLTLQFWDFMNHEIKKHVKVKKRSENSLVVEIEEIVHLKVLAVATSDKYIGFYSMISNSEMISLNLCQTGITSIRYFTTYQVLLITGYENTVPVVSLTPGFHDLEIRGRLVGHTSLVTAILPIENSPLVVTSDDMGSLKLWDIRKFSCFQTIKLGTKTNVGMFLDMKGRVGMIGNRVSAVDFDTTGNSYEKIIQYLPIGCEYNDIEEEIVVCCSNEIKFVDLGNGQTKRIFINMFNKEEEDQITSFCLIKKRDILVLANFRGNIGLFDYFNGKTMYQLEHHLSDVTMIHYDILNDIYISSSLDGTIMAQIDLKNQERKVEDVIKEQESKGAHLEIMPYKDIVTHKNGEKKKVLLSKIERNKLKVEVTQDFRNLRVLERIEKVQQLELKGKYRVLKTWKNPKPLQGIKHLFLSIYSNIVAGICFNGYVNFYNYEYFKLMASLKFEGDISPETVSFFDGINSLVVLSSDGNCFVFGFEIKSLSNLHMELLLRFNIREHELKESTGYYVYNSDLYPEVSCSNLIIKRQKIKKKKHEDRKFNRMDFDLQLGLKISLCQLYVGDSLGGFRAYEFKSLFLDSKLSEHANRNQSYNPHRTSNNQSITMPKLKKLYQKNPLELTPKFSNAEDILINSFRVHTKPFKTLKLLGLEKRYLMSFGYDLNVKVFDILGNIYCYVNVKHPLPVHWTINSTGSERLKEMTLHVLEVIEIMSKRYSNTSQEEENFDLDFLFKKFVTENNLAVTTDNDTFELTQVIDVMASKMLIDSKKTKKVLTMKEEFNPEDVALLNGNVERPRNYSGPSLRQLDLIRKQKESDNLVMFEGMNLQSIYKEAKKKLKDKPIKFHKMLNFFYNFEEENEEEQPPKTDEKSNAKTKKALLNIFDGKPVDFKRNPTRSVYSRKSTNISMFSSMISRSKHNLSKDLKSLKKSHMTENYAKRAKNLIAYAEKKQYIGNASLDNSRRTENLNNIDYKKKFNELVKQIDKRVENSRKKEVKISKDQHKYEFKDNPFIFKKVRKRNKMGIIKTEIKISIKKEESKLLSKRSSFANEAESIKEALGKKEKADKADKTSKCSGSRRFTSLPRIRRRSKREKGNSKNEVMKQKYLMNRRKKSRKFKHNLRSLVNIKI